ncbi:CHAT domain-containing protein [Mycena latifolia]|nr:CHAT domain-containing protein [Mycena latifolia]
MSEKSLGDVSTEAPKEFFDNVLVDASSPTEGQSEQAAQLSCLAFSLATQYRNLGEIKDLEAALQTNRAAVDLTPESHPERAARLASLAGSYSDRYHRLGELKDLEAALQIKQKALNLTLEEDPERANRLASLAVSLTDRYQKLGDLEDLNAALQHDKEAISLTPEGDSTRAGLLSSLAASFRNQYQRLGDLSDLDAASQYYQEAVDLTPKTHPTRADLLQDLAVSFGDRYRRLGNLSDLEAALQNFQEAVDLTPKGHSERVHRLGNLSVSLTDRYQKLGNLVGLNAALRNNQEALDLTPTGHPERARCLASLAVSLKHRYQRLGELEDLEAALQNDQEAADLTPEGHPMQVDRVASLAALFDSRYQRVGNLEDLKAALQNSEKALALLPEDHPNASVRRQDLALSLTQLYQISGDQKDLDAIHNQYSASFKTVTATPELSWNAALEWASFAAEFQSSDCPTAYAAAFQLLPEILWLSHGSIHRLDIPDVTSTATRTCVKLSYLMSAVEIMEQGLAATTFQQIFQLKPDLTGLPPFYAEMFQQLSSKLHGGKDSEPIHVAIERYTLVKTIRKEHGFENFLLPKPYSTLCSVAQGGPVVILNSHQDRCDGIVLVNPTSHPIHVPLPNVTMAQLKSQQVQLRDLLNHCNARARGESEAIHLLGDFEKFTSKTTGECFGEMLHWMWTDIVAPIYQVLESNGIRQGRLWWLPTGAFSGLPLHASSPTDDFIHSYTATLGSLLEARSKKSSTTPPKFGIVGVTHSGLGRMNSLKGVEEEVKTIIPLIKMPLERLEGNKATVQNVKQQLQDCSWFHLVCHGKQDVMDPTKSQLLLYGGSLELETILRMPLSNAQFVFLATCQTDMGDATLVNEPFYLGGGFIAAGFRGAIGTLWSMNDLDGAVVAEIVYSHLFRDGREPQVTDAAEALHLAVKELKARKVPYERWIPFVHMGI